MDSEEKLLEKYEPNIRAIARCFSRCGVDMDDLLQEGRVELLKAARKFDASRDLKLWGYASKAVFYRMLHIAGKGVLPKKLTVSNVDVLDESLLASSLPSPEEILQQKERLALVASALAQLSAEERQALVESIDSNESADDVSRQRTRRGRKKLARMLARNEKAADRGFE